VLQNEDRSLTLFWEGITVRCFGDAFMSLIGGTSGVPATKISNELLDALGFQARIQRAS
jgi:2-phosphoglycerate kinase